MCVRVGEVFCKAQRDKVVEAVSTQGLEGVSNQHAGVTVRPERQSGEVRREKLFLIVRECDDSDAGVAGERVLNDLDA